MKTKKAIFSRELQNGVEMVLRGYDNGGREIWVTAEYNDVKKQKSYSKYSKC